jgi:hypothetical protein
MNRRQFTAEAAMLLLGGAAITISGCGGGGSPAANTPVVTDKVGTVDTNHGHTALITAAELLAGNAIELDIKGTSGHGHKVVLEAADVVTIRKGQRFEKQSTGNSHTHLVVFNG